MRDRGIDNPDELLSFASAAVILESCEWFDAQKGVGPGVLAKAIREGGRRLRTTRSLLERQAEYGAQICDWLTEHFPEFTQASGTPHCAAITAVIHLHARDGKGQLTKGKHGSAIRAAVKAWEKKWSEQ